jgi:hypothetical protein
MTRDSSISPASTGHVTQPAARSMERLARAMAPTVFCPSGRVERCLGPKSPELPK